MPRGELRLFPALLRHYRRRQGLTQLDLALTAEVSTRHLSFLETGRAQPSEDMVLRLGATLGLNLREQNELLRAAGHEEAFQDTQGEPMLPPTILQAIDRMMRQQEPYPLTVLDSCYNVLFANEAATRLFPLFMEDPSALSTPMNVLVASFDPRLSRPFLVGWERFAQVILARLHREVLARPEAPALAQLLASLLRFPGVEERWKSPDFSILADPVVPVRLRRGDLSVSFLTTITIFNAPQQVALEDLHIESYFPLDEATTRACELLARGDLPPPR